MLRLPGHRCSRPAQVVGGAHDHESLQLVQHCTDTVSLMPACRLLGMRACAGHTSWGAGVSPRLSRPPTGGSDAGSMFAVLHPLPRHQRLPQPHPGSKAARPSRQCGKALPKHQPRSSSSTSGQSRCVGLLPPCILGATKLVPKLQAPGRLIRMPTDPQTLYSLCVRDCVCCAAAQWYPVAVEAALDPAVPHKVSPGAECHWATLSALPSSAQHSKGVGPPG